jgi:hypothetical protein
VILPYCGSPKTRVDGPSARKVADSEEDEAKEGAPLTDAAPVATVAGSEEDEAQEKPRRSSAFEAIYASCGYDTRAKAYEAFGRAKIQIRRQLRNVISERATRSQAGMSEADLEARIEDDLRAFQEVLDEDVFWHHVALSDGEGLGKVEDQRALRRYVEQKLNAAGALTASDDPSGASAPTVVQDLSPYDLCVIARAFSQEPETIEELAGQWAEFTAGAWTKILPDDQAEKLTADAATAGLRADSSLSDVLHDRRTPLELLRAIRESIKQRRRTDSETWSDRVLNAGEQACIAAALVGSGERITSKDDSRLRTHLAWLANRTWVDETTRELGRRAAQRLA